MRLLLVEDDERIAKFLVKGLREQTYAVDRAADGEDALYKLDVNEYDLMILDLMIPGPDGFEVCRRLRQSGSNMPVLMLTARDALEDRVTGLDTGADDYLTKPFEVSELLARVRALLRRGHILQPPNIQIGDLVLETGSRTVARSGKPISVTSKEYAVLEYLARNTGRVVGRAELAEHVWDEHYDPFSNVIDVHINRLRRKVDDGYHSPLIHTRRGAGYILSLTPPALETE
jgi:two-component system, OmpR family, copper resistance phosphate regulon response regulator CusR